jgi:hypothetical protein
LDFVGVRTGPEDPGSDVEAAGEEMDVCKGSHGELVRQARRQGGMGDAGG